MKNKLFLSVVMLLTSLGLFAQTPVYNVMDYGAKGDGITDDALAIQRAIDACSAKGGGQVYLPCGTPCLLELWKDIPCWSYRIEIEYKPVS